MHRDYRYEQKTGFITYLIFILLVIFVLDIVSGGLISGLIMFYLKGL